jgi:hypothetical protein
MKNVRKIIVVKIGGGCADMQMIDVRMCKYADVQMANEFCMLAIDPSYLTMTKEKKSAHLYICTLLNEQNHLPASRCY